MIWSSTPLMITVDVMIVGMVAVIIFYVLRIRGFRYGHSMSPGRWLLLGGIFVTAAFYVADLIIMTAVPSILGDARAVSMMDTLHREARWPVSMMSVAMISAGIFLLLGQRRRLESRVRESEDLLGAVRRSSDRSESRFRSIIEQTPYSIYCFEFDPPARITGDAQEVIAASHGAVLIECNRVFARTLNHEDPETVKGIRYGDMDCAQDRQSHERLLQDFVASRCRLVDYELAYTDLAGQERALQLSWDGVVKNGRLERIWGAEQNILKIKKTEAELASRKLFEQLVAEVSTKFIVAPEDSLSDELRTCLRLVCEYAETDRAVLLWINTETSKIELMSFWNEFGEPPWGDLSMQAFPWSSGILLSGSPCAVEDINAMPKEAAADFAGYTALGVKSTAGVPLSVGGAVQGVLTISNIKRQRSWSPQLMQELEVLGGLFGNTIWRIRSKQKLDIALAQLQQARDRLEAENVYLQQELRSTHGFDGLIGESHSFMKSLRQVEQVAATKTAVLIQGETGTGKELIARAIHARSDRNKRPLVKVNCAALPSNLIESELFGHEKGAFTGAQDRKRGRFDLAHRGTLFLDEIGDFPIDLQGKLLRVLQESEFERLGGTETLKVDVRLIAATNRNLRSAVDRGEFRADLFYRISTFPIELPALRDRHGDIPLLAKHFVRNYAQQLGREVTGVSTYMLDQLQAYSWPGNVRELEAVVQRAIIYAGGPVIDLHEPLQGGSEDVTRDAEFSLGDRQTGLRDIEREHIRNVLKQAEWVIAGDAGAATRLGVPPSTLRSKMKKLGIERPQIRAG